jgi:ParB-like chromosome segregation protein Spo0J
MNHEPGKFEGKITTVPTGEMDTGVESPLRLRKTLPGEEGQSVNDSELIDSVSRVGILHPPCLFSGHQGSLTVIFGHRRIAAAAACGREQIPSVIIPGNPPDRKEILELRTEETAYGEQLSEYEKIAALERLISFSGQSQEEISEPLSRCYGRRLSASHISRLTGLLETGIDTMDALHRGKVSTGNLLALSEHPLLDAGQAVALLSRENLSRGRQKEAVRLLLYLADQGEGRWEQFLRDQAGSEQPLLESLRLACRPTMHRDLGRIEEIMNGFNLPEDASIKPPPNLEGDSLRVSIRVREEEKFSEILRKLHKGLDEGRIRQALNILEGRS